MKRISIGLGAIAALTAQSAFAQTTAWTNPAGGSANVSSNWSAGVPVLGSTARFDLPGPYTVTFAAGVTTTMLDVVAGEVTLDLDRQMFVANSGINIGSNTSTFPLPAAAALVVQEGRLSTTSTLTVGRGGGTGLGTLTLRSGGVVDASSLRLENNSFVNIVGPGSALSYSSAQSVGSGGFINSQVLVTDGGAFLNTGSSSSSAPVIGMLTVRGAGSRIRNAAATSTLLESGASADFTTLTVIGGDFVADHSSVNVTDLAVGSSSVSSSTPPGRMILRASTLTTSSITTTPLRINSGASLELADASILTTRTLQNDGTLRGSGRSTGFLDNGNLGTVTVGSGERLSFESRAGNNSYNRGLITVTGGELTFNHLLSNQNSANPSGGGRIVGRDATLRFGDGSSGTGLGQTTGSNLTLAGGLNDVFGFINNGTKIIHTGNSHTLYYDNVINNGTIQTSAGSSVIFLGDVSGPGTFTGPGSVVFEGDLAPGASAAFVTFAGDVRLGEESRLVLEIGGTRRGSEYDALDVAGNLQLDGTVAITRINDFVPLPGQTFNFLTAASITGTPTIENATGLPGLQIGEVLTGGGLSVALSGTPGDANLDASVNFADLVALAQHYNLTGSQTWLEGDFNGDATVGFADLVALAQHYGMSAPVFAADWAYAQSLVPEPALLTMPAALLVAMRRRRK